MTGPDRGARSYLNLDLEIRTHLDMAVEDLVRAGVPRNEAEREALREFGDIEQVKRATLVATQRWLDPLRPILETAMSLKSRVVAIAVVGALGLIGTWALPLEALLVPTWHDHLSFTPKAPDITGTVRVCVSDFRVLSDGVLSFTVEDGRRDYAWFEPGKRYVIAADEFSVQVNNERCPKVR